MQTHTPNIATKRTKGARTPTVMLIIPKPCTRACMPVRARVCVCVRACEIIMHNTRTHAHNTHLCACSRTRTRAHTTVWTSMRDHARSRTHAHNTRACVHTRICACVCVCERARARYCVAQAHTLTHTHARESERTVTRGGANAQKGPRIGHDGSAHGGRESGNTRK